MLQNGESLRVCACMRNRMRRMGGGWRACAFTGRPLDSTGARLYSDGASGVSPKKVPPLLLHPPTRFFNFEKGGRMRPPFFMRACAVVDGPRLHFDHAAR